MSLAPALLTWTGTLQLIGAKEGPLSLERLLALPPDAALELNSSMMEYQFCTLATGQDSRQFDMPVAQWACTSGGGVAVAKERHKKVFGDMTACTVCIERAMAEGPGAKIVCEPTSDCESRELSLMKQPDLSGRAGVLTRGVPDIVHLLRLLMVLRASEDVSVHAAMVKAVNAATLRNKDRDSAEIQPRYHRDIAEMRPRYGVRPRSRGEMWPMYGEIRPSTPRYG
mmetsp:Transcript_36607/g.117365  ORF Transcript_36607/g.117365 Transcript_36607/m.117365 type:complete len:226 (+) Transcript_36607:460-1137(+)